MEYSRNAQKGSEKTWVLSNELSYVIADVQCENLGKERQIKSYKVEAEMLKLRERGTNKVQRGGRMEIFNKIRTHKSIRTKN